MPTEPEHAEELERIANDLVERASVNKQVLTTVPREQIEYDYHFYVQMIERDADTELQCGCNDRGT